MTLRDRGNDVSHESIRYWWKRFGPIFAVEIRRKRVAYHRNWTVRRRINWNNARVDLKEDLTHLVDYIRRRKLEEWVRDSGKIKKNLEARLRELDQRTHEIEDGYKELRDDDWSENAVEAEDDEVLDEMENLAIEEIQKIEVALTKIEAGTYGTCRICDKKSAAKRLEALPYATRCIDCAEAN